MKPESYYSPEGDIAYIQVRPQRAGGVRSEEESWGLRDYDRDTGELVGLEIWDASKALPGEVIEALPRLEGRGTVITQADLAKQPSA
ncbi:MAG: DUF2283 domain-containing protein [Solirubrobacterales bacterium]|nr:DUF2283 domain-containing protein [Solirubrobacterales bacterium]